MTLQISRAHARPDIPAVLELARAGRIQPARVTDRVIPFSQAADALVEPHTKLVFTRD